jgi:outer membrane protein OmpA-like peptidoglycan-associated protein
MELRQEPPCRRRLPRRGALRLLLPAAAAAPLAVASCAAPRTPPQPAASAPPAPASDRAYIVFFELGRADIGPRGRQIVAEAARNSGAPGGGAGRIELQAYADRSGRADRNQRLSQRRAEAVADELARQGVPRERIAIQAHGEGRPFVPTRDDVREARNRGVWIVLR